MIIYTHFLTHMNIDTFPALSPLFGKCGNPGSSPHPAEEVSNPRPGNAAGRVLCI